ncbi:MAG: hypothetical protein ACJ0DG_02110 [bacterium]
MIPSSSVSNPHQFFTLRHPPSITTTRTHEGKLLGVHIGVHRSGKGVHIGVYKPSHLIANDSTIDTIIR